MWVSPTDGESNRDLVLVVDNAAINRMIITRILGQLGLQVIEAESGEQALLLAETHNPGMVITDIHMPGMGGIEFTRQVKQRSGRNFLPVILVSADDESSLISNSIEVGGDAYLKRPFSAVALVSQIRALRRFRDLHLEMMRYRQTREREEELAEQLFSRAVEYGNVKSRGLEVLKRSAETFSGDLVLSARRPNGDLNILLGDITGHGLTTTIGALPVSETFRAMTGKGYDSEEIIAQVNRKLLRLLPTGMFVATALLSISADGHYVRIWNGGLPDILIHRKGEIRAIPSTHPPLGILPKLGTLSLVTERIDQDTCILLYSDGLVEACNSREEVFGDERLQTLLLNSDVGNGELIKQIDTALTEFMDGEQLQDDVTVVAVDGSVLVKDIRPLRQASATEEPMPEGAAIDHWNWNIELQGRTLARIDPVAQAMHQIYEHEGNDEHWQVIFSVLTELYVNALDHGILGLDSSLKGSPEGFVDYYREREERLSNLSGGSITVEIQHTRFPSGGRLIINVRDSGKGFDHEQWMAKAQRADHEAVMLSGRGIRLVSEICQSLRYLDSGTRAEAVYLYSNTTS